MDQKKKKKGNGWTTVFLIGASIAILAGATYMVGMNYELLNLKKSRGLKA